MLERCAARHDNPGVDVYEELVRMRREGRKAALATIINVRGSIPSFRTAKMLVCDDGSIQLNAIGSSRYIPDGVEAKSLPS